MIPGKQESTKDVERTHDMLGNKGKNSKANEIEKVSSYFSLEQEINKIKIPISLNKLVKNQPFKESILKIFHPSIDIPPYDAVKIHDENTTIVFFPQMDGNVDLPPPFYIIIFIHDKMLHNYLLDSGASHNLMQIVVLEALGLSINKHIRT